MQVRPPSKTSDMDDIIRAFKKSRPKFKIFKIEMSKNQKLLR